MLLETQTSIVMKVRDKEKEELQHWMVCAVYLIAGIDRRLLRDWWKKETQKRLLNFFILLARCLDVFEYQGAEAMAANASGAPPTTPGGTATPVGTQRGLDAERQYDDPMGIKRQTQQVLTNTHTGYVLVYLLSMCIEHSSAVRSEQGEASDDRDDFR
jgi:hypothetical protein